MQYLNAKNTVPYPSIPYVNSSLHPLRHPHPVLRLFPLPLLRCEAFRRPSVYGRDLGLQRRIDKSMSCERGLFGEQW